MDKNNLSQKVLEKIKGENIKPEPKWKFLLKDYVIWTIFALAVLIGSLVVAVICFAISNNDWDLYKYTHHSLLGFTFATLPYFWLVLFGVLVWVAYYNFKHTDKGYKYHVYTIIIVTLILSLLFGVAFYTSGFGKKLEDVFLNHVPFYGKFLNNREIFWHQPERGMLAGMIISISSERQLELMDVRRERWIINYQDSLIRDDIELTARMRIKILGKFLEDNNFKAIFISPDFKPKWGKFMPPPPPQELMKEKIELMRIKR